ncbi:hypothetical protein RFI02_09830 [Acinetobacter sichuanensis]|uniref:immunity protein Imm33 domain-containing protein n=1 Tax=Acinetobacter sichuanensis TaxID=2136183 RepID=UPI00280C66E7|nr:hypothetical protein [Acinetobacter sichuanensis]MDQ9021403.1 hypothetical protein [Acinetobacter sichuanensis]
MQKLAMSQQQICEKYHSKWNPIKPNEMVAIALQTLGQQPINASRVILREGETISWFIFCGEYSDAVDFYQPMHASHLDQYLPQVIPYLALDHGFNFIIDNEGYEDVWCEITEKD